MWLSCVHLADEVYGRLFDAGTSLDCPGYPSLDRPLLVNLLKGVRLFLRGRR